MYVSIQFQTGERLTFECDSCGIVIACLQDSDTGLMMEGFSVWKLPLGGSWSYVAD